MHYHFFGYFEIRLPSKFINKVDSASDIGGLVGIFFMALTLALVSFSCTGPVLGAALAKTGLSASGSDVAFSAKCFYGWFWISTWDSICIVCNVS